MSEHEKHTTRLIRGERARLAAQVIAAYRLWREQSMLYQPGVCPRRLAVLSEASGIELDVEAAGRYVLTVDNSFVLVTGGKQ